MRHVIEVYCRRAHLQEIYTLHPNLRIPALSSLCFGNRLLLPDTVDAVALRFGRLVTLRGDYLIQT